MLRRLGAVLLFSVANAALFACGENEAPPSMPQAQVAAVDASALTAPIPATAPTAAASPTTPTSRGDTPELPQAEAPQERGDNLSLEDIARRADAEARVRGVTR